MDTPKQKGSIFWGMVWMFVISLLLFWLPLAGPLIAGIVGGKKAGGVGASIAAVFLPGLILGLILLIFAAFFTGIPLLGFVAGFGGFTLVVSQVGPLLLGAIIGGLLAEI